MQILKTTLFFLFLSLLLACSEQADTVEIAIGSQAPAFQAQLLNKEAFELDQLKGKYVLLDFWGSWCAPCRKEHPDLVKIYQKFSGQKLQGANGFEIVSVAIEKDSSAWTSAIQKDQLPWPFQIMEQTEKLNKVKVPIAQAYKIEKVPARFLLSPEGVIVGVNPSPEAVRTYLNTK